MVVEKDKEDKENSDYEDAASQENARDPVLEVMLTVAGPNYSAWTRTDITGADPKCYQRQRREAFLGRSKTRLKEDVFPWL